MSDSRPEVTMRFRYGDEPRHRSDSSDEDEGEEEVIAVIGGDGDMPDENSGIFLENKISFEASMRRGVPPPGTPVGSFVRTIDDAALLTENARGKVCLVVGALDGVGTCLVQSGVPKIKVYFPQLFTPLSSASVGQHMKIELKMVDDALFDQHVIDRFNAFSLTRASSEFPVGSLVVRAGGSIGVVGPVDSDVDGGTVIVFWVQPFNSSQSYKPSELTLASDAVLRTLGEEQRVRIEHFHRVLSNLFARACFQTTGCFNASSVASAKRLRP